MPGVRPRVLIVEDVPSLAQTYAAFMTRGAFDVAIAVCGREALVCADAGHVHPPDAILLDISLPDMTGLEVLRELRGAGYPGEVIVATSHGSINLAVEAMREGAYDFLVKPFTADPVA